MTSFLQAVEQLRRGTMVAFPTESFWAFGVDAMNTKAIKQLFRVKHREKNVPIALICGSFKQVEKFFYVTVEERRLMKKHWPGSLTILLKPRRGIAVKALGSARIGVRVPRWAQARVLTLYAGVPITATSANESGAPPTKSLRVLRRAFPDILYVSGRCGRQTQPSTIIFMTNKKIHIIRQGAIHVS